MSAVGLTLERALVFLPVLLSRTEVTGPIASLLASLFFWFAPSMIPFICPAVSESVSQIWAIFSAGKILTSSHFLSSAKM